MRNKISYSLVIIGYLLEAACCVKNEINMYAMEGEKITLTCQNNNIDHWEQLNNTIHIMYCNEFRKYSSPTARLTLTEECNLQIKVLNQDFSVTYRCVIAGKSPHFKDFNIIIQKPPSKMNVLEANMTKLVFGIEGQQMTLTCDVHSGKPDETIFWMTNETVLYSGGPGRLKYTFIPQQDDHLQIYTCKANNSMNSVPLEKNVQLRLTLIPRISVHMKVVCMQKKMIASFYCSESSEWSVTRYNWFYNDAELIETSKELHITSLNKTNDGLYTCIVKNDAGSDNASMILQYDLLCQEVIKTKEKYTETFKTKYIALLAAFTALVIFGTAFLIKQFIGNRQQDNEDVQQEEEDMNGTAATNQLYHALSDLLAQPGASGYDTDVHSFQRHGIPHSNHKVSNNLRVSTTTMENNHRNSNGSFDRDTSPALPADLKISKCLKYVEVLFDPFPMGHKFVIRGSENRKPYALIDFDAHAEPLTSSPENSSEEISDEENVGDDVE